MGGENFYVDLQCAPHKAIRYYHCYNIAY